MSDDKTKITNETVVSSDSDKTRIVEKPDDKTVVLSKSDSEAEEKTRIVGDETTILAEGPSGTEETTVVVSNPESEATVIADQQATVLSDDSTVVGTSAQTLVSDGTRAPGVHGSAPSVSPLAKMVKGYVIKDRFVLERKLGEGGMGAVFHARDLRKEEARDPNPYVAIKVITGLLQKNSKAVIALQRETKKSQTLAHPNIITVYDFDRDDDIYYMTMESLKGQTLDDYIQEGNGKAEEKIRFINDIANGVSYAHQRNIIHSDLKPENVFVTEAGEIKILDFGIARAFAQGEEQTADPDELVGLTPTYASHEMFGGEDPHPSDDVYALGLIAYELLSGSHPFGRRSALEAEKEKLTAKKLKNLKSYQWQAISAALQFKRGGRFEDAIAFQRKFSGAGLLVKRLSFAMVAMLAGFAVYVAFFQPEAGPDIPFAELPAAQQQSILAKLEEGRQAMQFGDINGALFYFDAAYQEHPRNKEAVTELQRVVDKLVENFSTLGLSKQEQIDAITELLKYESLSQNKGLVDLKNDLEN
ncbi:serine/threonine protein kinase [Pseudoteredinibacter isoporae]|uniref:Serine/threonine protein kinase n=1 Tax=Pseudoteredinibacter isoporae TaxID=570281 RepID=A0A7X0JVG9_9GAMM|nr:serine/threonine-protein kinase [Pseudoteredinibacter isoporae]MBB6522999.1 serine/threonine protein kinase [Pseudoteredinibacter isoporae]NHO88523.1 protein kinase [Pseudoteredinibacter isoporae]NIB22078.1 protein kinase [Pseudoteredinibacter isoporae]